MYIDSDGNIKVTDTKPLNDINQYFHDDFDTVAHNLANELSKGDENEEMAEKLGYG